MAGGWPGPRRRMVGVKLDADTIVKVENLAKAEGLIWAGEPNTSEMLRRLIDEALAARNGGSGCIASRP